MFLLEDQVQKQFGENLRRERREAGFSQEDLAFRAGLHRTQVSLLESGRRLPRFVTIVKLKGSLGVSANELFARIEFEPYFVQSGGLQIGTEEGS